MFEVCLQEASESTSQSSKIDMNLISIAEAPSKKFGVLPWFIMGMFGAFSPCAGRERVSFIFKCCKRLKLF